MNTPVIRGSSREIACHFSRQKPAKTIQNPATVSGVTASCRKYHPVSAANNGATYETRLISTASETVEQVEVDEEADRARKDGEVSDGGDCVGRPLNCRNGLARAGDADGVHHERAEEHRPRFHRLDGEFGLDTLCEDATERERERGEEDEQLRDDGRRQGLTRPLVRETQDGHADEAEE